MTHAERMAKINADADAERAKILAERAEIHRKSEETLAEIRRKGEERRAAVNRIEEENERKFEKLRAAIAANDFDEMRRINEELTDSLIKVRQILGI